MIKLRYSRYEYLFAGIIFGVVVALFQNCSRFSAIAEDGLATLSSEISIGPDAIQIPASGSLQEAIVKASTKSSPQIFVSGLSVVSNSTGTGISNVIIPNNVQVIFGPFGKLVLDEGVKLEIRGAMAGHLRHQVFEYRGTTSEVTFLSAIRLLPQWWGAVADDQQNDITAFQNISRYVNLRKGGHIFIPNGTYLVGKQEFAGAKGKYFAYRGTNPIEIKDCTSPVIIEGESLAAKIRVIDNLKYGSFDPITGEAYNPSSMPFLGFDYASSIYDGLINGENNSDLTIKSLELDGNVDGLQLGGTWGDVGYQLGGTGIRLYSNRKVTIDNIRTHHHACDGIMIGYPDLTTTDPKYPHTINNLKAEHNGRNGLSWVGGNSLIVTNSAFNHSAQGRVYSPPAAGLDIEAEQSIAHNGYFENVEFINNKHTGVVADSGNGGYTTFKNCLLWGATALWPHKPGLKFENCKIYGGVLMGFGSPDPTLATQFYNVEFEDRPYPGASYTGDPSVGALVHLTGANIKIENSTIVANRFRGFYATGMKLIDVSVTLRGARPDNDFQGIIGDDTSLERVTFKMEALRTPASPYYIATGRNIRLRDVFVNGPHLVWSPIAGPSISGRIPDQH